jgi:hypothetical protein
MNNYNTSSAYFGGTDFIDESLAINEMNLHLPKFLTAMYYGGYFEEISESQRAQIRNALTTDYSPFKESFYPSRYVFDSIGSHFVVKDSNGNLQFNSSGLLEVNFTTLNPQISKGYLIEFAALFSLWVTRIQMLNRVQLTNSHSLNVSLLENEPQIVKKLYKVYFDSNPSSILKINHLLNPDLTKIQGNPGMDYLYAIEDCYENSSLDLNSNIYNYFSIINQAQVIIEAHLRSKTNLYLQVLGWNNELPDLHFICVGDGSGTHCLLNIGNAAVGLFSYEYTKNDDPNINNQFSGGAFTSGPPKIRTKVLNKRLINVQNKNKIHIGLYGVDRKPTEQSSNIFIQTTNNAYAVIERIYLTNNSGYVVDSRSYSSSEPFKVFRKGNLDIIEPYDEFTPPSTIQANGLDINWYDQTIPGQINICNDDMIAGWDHTSNDLTLFKNDGFFYASLRTTNNASYLKNLGEELFMIIAVYKTDIDLLIELENVYSEDRFELTKEQRLLKIANNVSILNYIDFFINRYNKTLGNLNLDFSQIKGNFIGKPKEVLNFGSSKIEQNTDYLFKLTETNEPSIGGLYEEFTAPDEDNKLLYSFGKIKFVPASNLSQEKFVFEIESYCSKEWSRLDRRFFFDIRNYGFDVFINGSNLSPQIGGTNGLDSFTIFGQGQNASTYAKIVSGPPENPGNTLINIPSYNHVLTILRSIGLLEAFLITVKYRADELGCTSLDSTSTIKNYLLNRLNDPINGLSVATHTHNLKELKYVQYLGFKWYMIQTTQSWEADPPYTPKDDPNDFESLTDV